MSGQRESELIVLRSARKRIFFGKMAGLGRGLENSRILLFIIVGALGVVVGMLRFSREG